MDTKKVESGVLAGVDISASKAKEVGEVAAVENAIGVMRSMNDHTATEDALASLMGVESRPVENAELNAPETAEGANVLTGVSIDENQVEAMDDVADTVEALKDAINTHTIKENPDIEDLGNALSSMMGVDK